MSGTANTGAGLLFGDPIDSYTLEQNAPQLVPSTPGEVARAVAGETIAGLPSLGLARRYVRAAQADPASYLASEPGPAFSNPVPALSDVPPEPNVPKDELNKDYGIPGVLSFDKDMPASIAQDIHDHHVAEIQRQDILQRNASGLASGGLARFLVSSAVSLADPLNVAAQFVPGLPEARVAGVLGEAALGAGGRAAVRAITGASQGALGTALLQPIDYLNNKADLDDWNMGTALSSVAFGGLLGGLLHPGIGAVGEALTGKLPDWAQKIGEQPTQIQEAMGRGATAAVLEDRPVAVDSVIDVHDALATAQELQSWAKQQSRINADFEASYRDAQLADDTSGAGTVDAQIASLTDRLTALRTEAESYRTELSPIQDRLERATMDEDTQARLDAIDAELQGTIPAVRRLALQGERTMLTEGAVRPDDLPLLRDQQQAQGLSVAASRTDAQAQQIEARLNTIKQRRQQIDDTLARSQSDLNAQTLRLNSKEEVTRAMAERTLRRYAGRNGVQLQPGEAAGLARDILSAKPADTAAAIKSAVDSISDRIIGPRRPSEGDIFDDPTAAVGDAVSQLQTQASADAEHLAQNATPKLSDADVSAKRELLRRIQEAPEISGRPEDAAKDQATAEKLNADFAEFVAGEKAAGRWTEDDDKALASIQQDEERTLAGAELCRSLGNCIAGGS